jgi:alpha-tubulin suppressor-like RCC1 family protein
VPVSVKGLSGATDIVIGYVTDCALLSDGGIDCWGGGPLGDGSDAGSDVPVAVTGITDATGLADAPIGTDTLCAVLGTGDVECWGTASYGKLGDDSTSNVPALTPVPADVSDVAGITSGGSSFCVTQSTQRMECWGSNVTGELGTGTTYTTLPYSDVPVGVSEIGPP